MNATSRKSNKTTAKASTKKAAKAKPARKAAAKAKPVKKAAAKKSPKRAKVNPAPELTAQEGELLCFEVLLFAGGAIFVSELKSILAEAGMTVAEIKRAVRRLTRPTGRVYLDRDFQIVAF